MLVISAFLLVATGCASVQTIHCTPDQERAVNDLMYFGTAKPGGAVTPEQWAEFLKNSITPRFPQGLTVWRASGQWRGADGITIPEETYVLCIVHPDDQSSDQAIRAIVQEYKRQFSQESVLRVTSQSCASF